MAMLLMTIYVLCMAGGCMIGAGKMSSVPEERRGGYRALMFGCYFMLGLTPVLPVLFMIFLRLG